MPIYNTFGRIQIDEARIDETCNAYFKWKDLQYGRSFAHPRLQ